MEAPHRLPPSLATYCIFDLVSSELVWGHIFPRILRILEFDGRPTLQRRPTPQEKGTLFDLVSHEGGLEVQTQRTQSYLVWGMAMSNKQTCGIMRHNLHNQSTL